MRRSQLFIVLSVPLGLSLLFGCATVPPITLGPEPTEPEVHFTIRLESIPSGADVYEVDPKDGTLGQKVGRTPMNLDIGLGCRYWSSGTRYYKTCRLWSPCVDFGSYRLTGSDEHVTLLLNASFIKEGYATEKLRKQVALFGDPYEWPPRNLTITVPLTVSVPATHGARDQQQQQQQQTVVIPGGQSETAQMGTVMVSSNVEGADVYVDGVFVGNTPANLKLKDGIHIIEVKKSGYSNYRKELRVFGGSELSLRADLTQ